MCAKIRKAYPYCLNFNSLSLLQYESIIATLCENLDTLDEPEARASMIWIIGETIHF
jgi:hypothetical protein